MARLPVVGGDRDNWGQVLNDYLSVEHNADGSLKLRTDGSLSNNIADGSVTASKLSASVNSYLASAQTAVQSVNGKTGQAVTLTASDVSAVSTSAAGAASGVATLDGSSKLTASQVPSTVASTTGATERQQPQLRSGAFTWRDPDVGSVLDFIPVSEHAAIKAGTSVMDVVTYFEAAQVAYKKILIPEGRYYLSRLFQSLSNRTWEGQGQGTLLYNPQTDANITKHSVIGLGDFHPAAFKYVPTTALHMDVYDLNSITAGDRTVTMTVNGDEANFEVGSFAWVRTVEEELHDVADPGVDIWYPYWAQLVKIESVDTTAHTITFESRIRKGITNACISPIGSATDSVLNIPWQAVENVTIRDMSMAGRIFLSPRGCAYRCNIENIWAEDALDLICANAFFESSFRNIKGQWRRRQTEVACYSQSVTIDKIEGPCVATSGIAAGLSIHEQSADITCRNHVCEIGADNTDTSVYALDINSLDVTIEDCHFAHLGSGAGSQVGFIRSNSFAGYGPTNINLTRVGLVSGSARSYHLRVGITGESEPVTGLKISALKAQGVVSAARSIKFEHNVATVLAASELPYINEVNSTGKQPMEMGNRLTTATDFASIIQGSGTPSGVISAPTGSLFQRVNGLTLDALYAKTNGYSSSGWLPVMLNSGMTVRGDASFVTDANSSWHQYFNTALTADRSIALPGSISSAITGVVYFVWKASAAGAGTLTVRQPDNSTPLVVIPAATKGLAICVWNGTTFSCPGYITLT